MRNNTMEMYDSIAPLWARLRSAPKQEWSQYLPLIKKGAAVLDIGCGNGRLYELLRPREIEYTGVDQSREQVEFAQTRYSPRSSSATFFTADMLSLPVKDSSFDVVFVLATLHHLRSPDQYRRALQEIRRVLRAGGLLVMENWNLGSWRFSKRYGLWRLWCSLVLLPGKIGDRYRNTTIPWKIPGQESTERFYHSFTLRELRRLVKGAGFEIQALDYQRRGVKTHWWNGDNSVLVARSFR